MAATYGKRPLWQWLVIYLVIGVVIYGLVYYFILAKKGGTNYGNPQQTSVSSEKAGNSIEISNFSFSPSTLNIKVGDTVTWTNKDSVGHSAVADDNSFDTGVIAQGQSGTTTFTKAGTYSYHCSIHPSMHGTIIVK